MDADQKMAPGPQDTCSSSQLFKGAPQGVLRELAVDPIILGELRFGILLLQRGKGRARLERWIATGVRRLHCIAWDAECGLRWAELVAGLRGSGRSMPIKDSLIAATALVHRLTVATRNRSDFEQAGVAVVNPFS